MSDSVTRIPVPVPTAPYDVIVGAGVLNSFPGLGVVPEGAERVLVVSQQTVVDAGHVGLVERGLAAAGLTVHVHLVPDGEQAKTVDVLADLWAAAAAVPLSRRDVVVAVGGGVVGDLAGFAAATYNRGIAVIQVPTTVLAQVDAAVGGKTGINLAEGKNLVGAFHQPAAVVCDVTTLTTLPQRIVREGFGEIVKYGLIHDPQVLALLEQASDGFHVDDAARITELVTRSVEAKAHFVGADEREAGIRGFLNFGHTYGHAVETLTGYQDILHGEAVAIGMVVALRLGVRLDRTPQAVATRAETLLTRLGLPVRGPKLDRDAVWEVMARDKKATSSAVRFVVLDDLARPVILAPDRRDVDAVLDAFDG